MAKLLNKAVPYVLSTWPWQAFVSLSWRRVPSEGVRERIFFGWIREIGKHTGQRKHPTWFLWARREELGERTQREHLHVLVGGLPSLFVRDFILQPRSAVGFWWESLGGGNVRTSRVYSASEVVEYFSKDSTTAGHEYELGKFGSASFMLSQHALCRLDTVAKEREGHSAQVKRQEDTDSPVVLA